MLRAVALTLALAGCAEEPFTYAVEVPPQYVVEGFEWQQLVEVSFGSYEAARSDLRLTVVEPGTSNRRDLAVGCSGAQLGTPLGESVLFRWSSSGIFIDTRTCSGTDGHFVLLDCGC